MPEITQESFIEYLKNPIAYPEAFKDYVSDYFATNVPKLHVSQIFGFKLHSIRCADDVPANESPPVGSYGNMTTPGPKLEDIANGFYVVMWGCRANVAATASTYMSIEANSATPTGQLEMLLNGTEADFSVGRLAFVELKRDDGLNTLWAKYKSTLGSQALSNRWLHAIKVVTEDG